MLRLLAVFSFLSIVSIGCVHKQDLAHRAVTTSNIESVYYTLQTISNAEIMYRKDTGIPAHNIELLMEKNYLTLENHFLNDFRYEILSDSTTSNKVLATSTDKFIGGEGWKFEYCSNNAKLCIVLEHN